MQKTRINGVVTYIPKTQQSPPPAPPPADDEAEEAEADVQPVPEDDNTTTPSGKTLADVQQMDDNELHDFLISVNDTDVPDMLNTHHLQRMVYALGLNSKPEIVSQKEFDDLRNSGAVQVWRTVDPGTTQSGVPLTAKQVNQMFVDGDLTYLGRGIHGDGLYFSDVKSGSLMYGMGGGRSSVVTGVINKNARIISEGSLRNMYDNYVNTHPRTRRALGFARSHSTSDSMSQFALLMGYNVISSYQGGGETYYTVIDRSAISTTGKLEKY